MEFKIFYHDIFQKHLVPDGHPEKPDRIVTLNNMISKMFLKKKQKIKSRKILGCRPCNKYNKERKNFF